LPKNVAVIAIDGPAAAGKTVIGRELAHRLGFKFLDTGLMYRAVGWLARQRNIPSDDQSALGSLARHVQLRWKGQDGDYLLIGEQRLGRELSDDPEVSHWASVVATVSTVRRAMVMLQQSIAAEGSIVMVGRDIGTVVAPGADLKIFMTASVEERARRRWRDLSVQGREVDYDQVLRETRERDDRDSARADSPLVPAGGAITINTDDLSIDQAVDAILQHFKLKAEK